VMLKEIGTYLQSQGIGTLGANLFLGLMPDQPDNCIALFEYAGSPPDLHWNGEYPGLQVRVRNKSYAAARTKIGEVMAELHGLYEQTLRAGEEPDEDDSKGGGEEVGEPTPATGTRYLLIKARGSPEVLKRDNNNRVELFVNFEIIKERE
jgi:hypothetical protein